MSELTYISIYMLLSLLSLSFYVHVSTTVSVLAHAHGSLHSLRNTVRQRDIRLTTN